MLIPYIYIYGLVKGPMYRQKQHCFMILYIKMYIIVNVKAPEWPIKPVSHRPESSCSVIVCIVLYSVLFIVDSEVYMCVCVCIITITEYSFFVVLFIGFFIIISAVEIVTIIMISRRNNNIGITFIRQVWKESSKQVK